MNSRPEIPAHLRGQKNVPHLSTKVNGPFRTGIHSRFAFSTIFVIFRLRKQVWHELCNSKNNNRLPARKGNFSMHLRLCLSALFLSAAAFVPQIASAQYGLSSSSFSNASGSKWFVDPYGAPYYGPYNDPQNDSHAGLIGPVSSKTDSSAYIQTDSSYSAGDAAGTAGYGKLHAEASGSANGMGSAISRWFDTITISSTTLPAGSPVTLLATAVYSGTLSGFSEVFAGAFTNPFGPDAKATVTFKTNIGNLPLPYTAAVDVSSPGYTMNSSSLPINQTMQQTVATYVGATLTLDSEIDLSAISQGNGFKTFSQSSGSVDSVFDVQSQTTGITLIRASASATPAPSAFVTVLLGSGMLGIVSRRRRRGGIRC